MIRCIVSITVEITVFLLTLFLSKVSLAKKSHCSLFSLGSAFWTLTFGKSASPFFDIVTLKQIRFANFNMRP